MVHRAVAMRREALDEQACADGSYGFRQGRRPHEARHERRERCMRDHIGWSVDAAVSGSCDSMARTRLHAVRRQRGNDGRRLRLIGPWLRAGGMEDARRSHPETGVVPGGVRAPVRAKRVLQPGLEDWCAQAGQPGMQGRGVLMRCADALVIGCEAAADARRIMDVLPKRGARYGLTIHPTKTTLLAFRQPAARQGSADGRGTGDLLGLTHDWTTARRGCWVSKRRTASTRLRRTTKSLWRWCRSNRHASWHSQSQQWGQQ
jgi:hypothetical protein